MEDWVGRSAPESCKIRAVGKFKGVASRPKADQNGVAGDQLVFRRLPADIEMTGYHAQLDRCGKAGMRTTG